MKPDITPKLKVSELLKEYPELEKVLIELAPVFSKLHNPVLRNTVARITTLQQAAVVGKVPLDKLINTLRIHAGIVEINIVSNNDLNSFQEASWLKDNKVSRTVDIRPVLDKGEQPVSMIINLALGLRRDESLVVINSFVPAPLMDILKQKGFQLFLEQSEDQLVKLYIGK